MKLFAKQLWMKLRTGPGIVEVANEVQDYPRLEQVLEVVDLNEDMAEVSRRGLLRGLKKEPHFLNESWWDFI